MKLWTTMPKEVYVNTVLKNGVYICDPPKCDMLLDDTEDKQFGRAYAWILALCFFCVLNFIHIQYRIGGLHVEEASFSDRRG